MEDRVQRVHEDSGASERREWHAGGRGGCVGCCKAERGGNPGFAPDSAGVCSSGAAAPSL